LRRTTASVSSTSKRPWTLRARIRRTFGADLADSLVEVDAIDGDVRLSGFVAPPRFARGTPAGRCGLNGRRWRDKVLLRALRDGYKGFLFDSRQPVAFLSLSLDPARVDVNVHSSQAEVRFRDERRMFGFIVNTLRDAVKQTDMATPGCGGSSTACCVVKSARCRSIRGSVDVGRRAVAALDECGSAELRARARADACVRRSRRDDGSGPPVPLRADAPVSASTSHGPFLQVAATYIVRASRTFRDRRHSTRCTIASSRSVARRDAQGRRRDASVCSCPTWWKSRAPSRSVVGGTSSRFARIGIELSAFGETTVAVQVCPRALASARRSDRCATRSP